MIYAAMSTFSSKHDLCRHDAGQVCKKACEATWLYLQMRSSDLLFQDHRSLLMPVPQLPTSNKVETTILGNIGIIGYILG